MTLNGFPATNHELLPEAGRSNRLAEVDGLRGAGVLLVISKHYGFPGLLAQAHPSVGPCLSGLWLSLSGVDLFFVLSGLLLGGKLLDDSRACHTFASFYIRRACRTLPLYFLVLLSFLASVPLLSDSVGYGMEWPFGTPWSLAAYALFVQNMLMVWGGSLGPQWLMVTWSLAAQEKFYLLLPWLTRLCHRPPMAVLLLTSLILLAPLCRWIALSTRVLPEAQLGDTLLICRTDSLCLGVLAAYALRIPPWPHRVTRTGDLLGPLALALFAGFACLNTWGSETTRFIAGHLNLALFYLALILTVTSRRRGLLAWAFRARLLREAARLSYGLFLFHMPVKIVVHGALLGAPTPITETEGLCATVTALFLAVALSELAWQAVEKPAMNWARKVTD